MTVRANALGSRYELESEIGTGAMGTVWRARDLSTQEAVAAKVLHDHFSSDVGIITRFLQERTFLLQLDHPSIVRVRDLVVEGNQLGIVMDLVEGGPDGADVRQLLKASPSLPPAQAAAIVGDVLDALAHAHALSVLHRDVKPDNVLLDDGRARLSDFSIARLAQETTVRMTGVLGTADYMAPEVFAEEVSKASDVYGAGVLLYELLAGRTPFGGPGANAWSIAKRHETTAPPPVVGLPEPLADLLRAMLEKEPTQRPTAAAAAAELRRIAPDLAGLAALPVQEQPTTWEEVRPATGGISLTSATPGIDVDKTYLGGATTVGGAPMPVAGPAPVAPAAEGDAALTQLGQVAPSRPALDVPEIVAPAAAPGRPTWHKVVAGVVALAVIGVVVALLASRSGGKKGGPPAADGPATTQIAADADVEQSEVGLTIQRHAVYDPKDHTITVTVTYASAHALTGPFLESVPNQSADDVSCPSVAWPADVPHDIPGTSGLPEAGCGEEIDPGAVEGRKTLSYTVRMELKGKDKLTALQAWVTRASALQTQSLEGIGFVSDFAAQRLEGLAVKANGTPFAGQQVDLKVLPVWKAAKGGTKVDAVDPLYSTAQGFDQVLLAQLGGGSQLSFSSPDCPNEITFGKGRPPYATTPAASCTITASLGNLSDSYTGLSVLQRQS